ncbi:DUF4345 domain-containing protein [Sediminibacter sp. Hel_I_10]|uniref:DUF4345 domain-containing protein n=1 Tax=Sediminibacter sp. Hel_I_10 TaxID=1392490 RepID=UPI0009DFFC62|nr:DUF4345 domain-containing protein [Sediminibacter sp. Hel_I_10]
MNAIIIQVFLVLYGIIALITGFMGITAKYDPSINVMADNSHRFVAAIWAATAIGFVYCAFNLNETALFRFLIISLVIGGIVRASSAFLYHLTPFIIFGIFLEVVVPPILWYLQSNISSNK